MEKSRSSSENEPCCSKSCKKNPDSLNKSIKKELEVIKNEKEGLESELTGFKSATKDLDHLIGSQRSDKIKEGLGYSVVPPPPAQIYSPPKKDMSWTGLPKFADDTIIDYSRPSPTIESNTDDTNKNSSVTETKESSSIITSKPTIKFVKAVDRPTERPTTDKVETMKKPSVKYAELYRKNTKSSKVRGNQRNWNNLKSHQLGANFVMKKKACYNYGGIDHLSYDCGKWVKMGRSCPKNNNTHKSMPPRLAIHRPYTPPMRPVRPNVNNARPQTPQDLMFILIQRVKRLERELKARTLTTKIHKVKRSRSRQVPTAEFPLPVHFSTASEDKFPLLMYFATAITELISCPCCANSSAWVTHQLSTNSGKIHWQWELNSGNLSSLAVEKCTSSGNSAVGTYLH
nr:hypothetical protein [Tanacetum cinerariifolium]